MPDRLTTRWRDRHFVHLTNGRVVLMLATAAVASLVWNIAKALWRLS